VRRGAVEIVFRRQVEEAADPGAKKAELIKSYRRLIDVYVAARVIRLRLTGVRSVVAGAFPF
jgi:hypothetical protein